AGHCRSARARSDGGGGGAAPGGDRLAGPPARAEPAGRRGAARAPADAGRHADLRRRREPHPPVANEEAGSVLRRTARPGWRLAGRIGLKVLYWAAVLAISAVILVALILLIDSRDKSTVGHGG